MRRAKTLPFFAGAWAWLRKPHIVKLVVLPLQWIAYQALLVFEAWLTGLIKDWLWFVFFFRAAWAVVALITFNNGQLTRHIFLLLLLIWLQLIVVDFSYHEGHGVFFSGQLVRVFLFAQVVLWDYFQGAWFSNGRFTYHQKGRRMGFIFFRHRQGHVFEHGCHVFRATFFLMVNWSSLELLQVNIF